MAKCGSLFNFVCFGDEAQAERRNHLVDRLRACPIPDDENLTDLEEKEILPALTDAMTRASRLPRPALRSRFDA